jgi:hypothetical protein
MKWGCGAQRRLLVCVTPQCPLQASDDMFKSRKCVKFVTGVCYHYDRITIPHYDMMQVSTTVRAQLSGELTKNVFKEARDSISATKAFYGRRGKRRDRPDVRSRYCVPLLLQPVAQCLPYRARAGLRILFLCLSPSPAVPLQPPATLSSSGQR